MSTFRIHIDLSELIPPGSALDAATLPYLSNAVKQIAASMQAQWMAYAAGAPLPNGKSISSRSGGYTNSIQKRDTSAFSAEVYSELPYAQVIEEGAGAYDMKRILGSSLKVRTSKEGHRYLIIPFRHFHPGAVAGNPMPPAVQNWWRGVSRSESSHITGHGWRDSGTGVISFRNLTTGRYREAHGQTLQVRSRTYHWGRKLAASDLQGMGLDDAATRRLVGMYRLDKPGAPGRHSQFINFRVMSEASSGWVRPAREGLWPARTTADQFRPIAEEAFKKAVEEDVRAALGGA